MASYEAGRLRSGRAARRADQLRGTTARAERDPAAPRQQPDADPDRRRRRRQDPARAADGRRGTPHLPRTASGSSSSPPSTTPSCVPHTVANTLELRQVSADPAARPRGVPRGAAAPGGARQLRAPHRRLRGAGQQAPRRRPRACGSSPPAGTCSASRASRSSRCRRSSTPGRGGHGRRRHALRVRDALPGPRLGGGAGLRDHRRQPGRGGRAVPHGSTASRWRSSSPRCGCASSRPRRSSTGSRTGSGCSPAAGPPRRPGSRRWTPPWAGATTSARRPSS